MGKLYGEHHTIFLKHVVSSWRHHRKWHHLRNFNFGRKWHYYYFFFSM